jgi:hypothetical protein
LRALDREAGQPLTEVRIEHELLDGGGHDFSDSSNSWQPSSGRVRRR